MTITYAEFCTRGPQCACTTILAAIECGHYRRAARPREAMPVPTVPDMLAELGEIYRERNKIYGDNYKQFGGMMLALFPRGITLNTPLEHNRFALFLHIATKLSRYAQSWPKGHADSLDDIAVYAQMLQELDRE